MSEKNSTRKDSQQPKTMNVAGDGRQPTTILEGRQPTPQSNVASEPSNRYGQQPSKPTSTAPPVPDVILPQGSDVSTAPPPPKEDK